MSSIKFHFYHGFLEEIGRNKKLFKNRENTFKMEKLC